MRLSQAVASASLAFITAATAACGPHRPLSAAQCKTIDRYGAEGVQATVKEFDQRVDAGYAIAENDDGSYTAVISSCPPVVITREEADEFDEALGTLRERVEAARRDSGCETLPGTLKSMEEASYISGDYRGMLEP